MCEGSAERKLPGIQNTGRSKTIISNFTSNKSQF